MGVLLQGFFFGPGHVIGVPSPLDGDPSIQDFWWDHLAKQAHALRVAGFSAIWLPPPLKGASGASSSGYDLFDDYDLGSKDQKRTIPTRYGSREQLARCVAVMRSNGIDVYLDMVENHRDGDDGHFNFKYKSASGAVNGRFDKGPGDFHPHVPEDPGVFSDTFSFGRDLAPINGIPRDHCAKGLIDAADWLTRALDVQGYRLDNMKGVSTVFLTRLLSQGAMANKFAFGEFADGNLSLLRTWMDAVQHRASAIDFPLHFMLKDMCNNAPGFDMSRLDHAGLAGVDPLGAITFVENHDTDRGGLGGPIVRNKLLAYAYILTSEGYPAVFYRDYSKDNNCFGLKDSIDRLIWIHENLASGPTTQRWKDNGVFAYERLGGARLLTALNIDGGNERTIKVATTFGPNADLEEFTGQGHPVRTDGAGNATITIPRNQNGRGYVCYSRPRPQTPFSVQEIETTQEFAGADDLDIGAASTDALSTVCRVWVNKGKRIHGALFFDAAHWTATTSIRLELLDPKGQTLKVGNYLASTSQGTPVQADANETGFHAFRIRAFETPPVNARPSFHLKVSYTASQQI